MSLTAKHTAQLPAPLLLAKPTPAAEVKEEVKPSTPLTPPKTIWRMSNGKQTVNLEELEAKLTAFSFVSGFAPGREDRNVLRSIQAEGLASEALKPQTARWLRAVTAYSESEVNEWM